MPSFFVANVSQNRYTVKQRKKPADDVEKEKRWIGEWDESVADTEFSVVVFGGSDLGHGLCGAERWHGLYWAFYIQLCPFTDRKSVFVGLYCPADALGQEKADSG